MQIRVRYFGTRGWYVARGLPSMAEYLHTDGVWRSTTASAGGMTGYYSTETAAITEAQKFDPTIRVGNNK